MPFQSAPDCASAAIHITLGGKDMVNVLNFHFHTLSYSQADLDALAALVDLWVNNDYKPILGNDAHYDLVHVRGLTNIIDQESTDNTHAGSGSAGVDSAPANVSDCVTLKTGHTGRSARGRFYSIGVPNSVIVNSQNFNAGYGVSLVTLLLDIQTAATTAGWDMVVLSRRTGGALRPTATFLLVNDIVVRNVDIDSQRGRLLPNH